MDRRPQYRKKARIIFLFLIILLIIIALAGRLIWIQVVNSSNFRNKALDQRLKKLKVKPRRGVIYDRNGKELAVNTTRKTIVGLPEKVRQPRRTAEKLSHILTTDFQTIYNRLTREAAAVYIERKVSEKKVREIQTKDLRGITTTNESKRLYPKGFLASHVLGFTGIDNHGLEGLELSYNKYLEGVPGNVKREQDITGRVIPGGIKKTVKSKNGHSIYLTIDEVVQYIAERELEKAMKKHNISGATALVMNPKNGALLALANRPAFNPNQFSEFPQKNWRNRAISDSFEPGSTFKIITTASSLEAGVVNKNDMFVDPGHVIVENEKISCWKNGGHGPQTFAEVVQNSCNPGFVQVGMRLGKKDFYKYIKGFGFGEETGVQLPGEARGLVYDLPEIGPVELATMSFGHGITVTPIQLITAVSAVANKGKLVRPRLVEKVVNQDKEIVEEIEPEILRQVVSEKTARQTLTFLRRVVARGTGQSAQIDGYAIGGKTGTAKHYNKQIYDSSFIGILPIDNPQLVILVVLYNLQGKKYYASQTAAPIFRQIALNTLRYLEIPPQTSKLNINTASKKIKIPKVTGLKRDEAKRLLRKKGLHVKVIGKDNKILKQVPLARALVKPKSTVMLYTSESSSPPKSYVTVPDLRGLKRKEAALLLQEIGLILGATGSGEITSQNIPPGSRLVSGSRIKVRLR